MPGRRCRVNHRPLRFPDDLALPDSTGTILLVVLDGLGGLPNLESGATELEAAQTPNMDALAGMSSLGMLLPVAAGVTPGSGPGHLALFGYDPKEHLIGRGALSALGVGFDLVAGDVAVRLNLATLDEDGRITDRRAGRPSDDEGRRVVGLLRERIIRRPRRSVLPYTREGTPCRSCPQRGGTRGSDIGYRSAGD